MAKLTRYSSFEELKSDIQSNTRTEAERDSMYAELEEFIKLLQQDLAAKSRSEAVEFFTTGRQPAEQEFARINERV